MRHEKQTVAPTASDKLDGLLLGLRLCPAQRNAAPQTDDEKIDVPVERVAERASNGPNSSSKDVVEDKPLPYRADSRVCPRNGKRSVISTTATLLTSVTCAALPCVSLSSI